MPIQGCDEKMIPLAGASGDRPMPMWLVGTLLLLLLLLLSSGSALGSLADDLVSLSGARTKVVFLRSNPQVPGWGDFDWDCQAPCWTVMVFDSAEGVERTLVPGPIGARLPIITPDGARVIYSDPDADRIWIIDWDGSNKRELVLPMPGQSPARATFATCCGTDQQGRIWVYADHKPYTGLIYRYLLDDPSTYEVAWDRFQTCTRFTVSRDMSRAAFESAHESTRRTYVAVLPNVSYEGPYTNPAQQTCNTQMAPDNSYRVFCFGGDHQGLSFFDAGGANRRWIEALGSVDLPTDNEVWAPRWSNNVHVFSMMGPLFPMSDGNVYVCRFDPAFTAIENYVQLTTTSCSSMAHVWIQPMPPSQVDSFLAEPAAIQPGQSSQLTWQTSNAAIVTLDGGPVSLAGSTTVSPTSTTTYTLVASNADSSATQQVTVVVDTGEAVSIDSFVAQPPAVRDGQQSVLTWTTSNAVSVTLDGEAVNADSSLIVFPAGTTSYTLSVAGVGGPVTKTVTVTAASEITGLVAHWPMDGNTQDASGNNHHGSVVGDVSSVAGKFDGAMYFDGDGDRIEVQHSEGLDITGPLTISLWVKKASYGGMKRLIGKRDGDQPTPYDLKLESGGSGWFTYSHPDWSRCEQWLGINVTAETWTHLAITRDGEGNLKTYMDGQLVQEDSHGTEVMSTGNVLLIGGGDGLDYRGAMDDVRLYNVALSAAEIVALYGGQAASGAVDVVSFTATPATVTAGQSSVLTWDTLNATSATQSGADVEVDGSLTVSPEVTTVFTLTAEGPGGPVTMSVTVTVEDGLPPSPAAIDSFSADPASIVEGGSSTLSWTTSNATAATLDGAPVDVNGSVVVSPTSTTTYTLSAEGEGGTVLDHVTVIIETSGPSIEISSPSAGDVLYAGTDAHIRWIASGIDDVRIFYSTDASDWVEIVFSLGSDQPGWGDYVWSVPDEPSMECTILVVGYFGDEPTESGVFEIRARYDSDDDGMADAWETSYFGDLLQDQTTDADGDGILDIDEFLTGSDPLVPDIIPGSGVDDEIDDRADEVGFSCVPGTVAGVNALAAVLLLPFVLLIRRRPTLSWIKAVRSSSSRVV